MSNLLKDEQMLAIDHYVLYSGRCTFTTLNVYSDGELLLETAQTARMLLYIGLK